MRDAETSLYFISAVSLLAVLASVLRSSKSNDQEPQMRLEPQWISVADRLPEIPEGVTQWFDGPRVLVVYEKEFQKGVYDVCEKIFTPQGEWSNSEGREATKPPLYWRPMPTFTTPKKEAANV